MPIDLVLIKAVLQSLANNRGRGPVTEELVALDLEAALKRPSVAHQVRGALAECARHAWACETKDDFDLPLWQITDLGETKRSNL